MKNILQDIEVKPILEFIVKNKLRNLNYVDIVKKLTDNDYIYSGKRSGGIRIDTKNKHIIQICSNLFFCNCYGYRYGLDTNDPLPTSDEMSKCINTCLQKALSHNKNIIITIFYKSENVTAHGEKIQKIEKLALNNNCTQIKPNESFGNELEYTFTTIQDMINFLHDLNTLADTK